MKTEILITSEVDIVSQHVTDEITYNGKRLYFKHQDLRTVNDHIFELKSAVCRVLDNGRKSSEDSQPLTKQHLALLIKKEVSEAMLTATRDFNEIDVNPKDLLAVLPNLHQSIQDGIQDVRALVESYSDKPSKKHLNPFFHFLQSCKKQPFVMLSILLSLLNAVLLTLVLLFS